MEFSQFANEIAEKLIPYLPFLVKAIKIAGEKGIEKIGEKSGKAAFDQAKIIWKKISEKKSLASNNVQKTGELIVEKPDDLKAKRKLRNQLKELFIEDPSFFHELLSIINEGEVNTELSNNKKIVFIQDIEGKSAINTTIKDSNKIHIKQKIRESDVLGEEIHSSQVHINNIVKRSDNTKIFQDFKNQVINIFLPKDESDQKALLVPLSLIVFFIIVFVYPFSNFSISPMNGELNVAILPLVEQQTWGFIESGQGERIAKIITVELQSNNKLVDDGIRIDFRGPDGMFPIFGSNLNNLDLKAESISKKLNAQIVIYGTIKKDEYGDPIVNTQVYISPENFGDAQELIGEELTGELEFGSFRLTSETDSGIDLIGQNPELQNRIKIYSLVIKALSAYISEDFSLAQNYLGQANEPILWKNLSGLEVIQLISGNAFLREARVKLNEGDGEAASQLVDQSKACFFKATRITEQNKKGQYARSLIGLAGAENLLALIPARLSNDLKDVNMANLEQASVYLDDAFNAKYKPRTADIQEKIWYGRAQIALTKYQIEHKQSEQQKAKENYSTVIEAYEKGNKRLREIAALSYSGLAIIARNEKKYDSAITLYRKAYETTHLPSLKVQLLVHIGNVYYNVQDYNNAIKYYSDAIDRKVDLKKAITDQQILEIEQRINQMKLGGIYEE